MAITALTQEDGCTEAAAPPVTDAHFQGTRGGCCGRQRQEAQRCAEAGSGEREGGRERIARQRTAGDAVTDSWMPSFDLPIGVEYPYLEMASLDLTGTGLNAAGCSFEIFNWPWGTDEPEMTPELVEASAARESLPTRLETLGEQLTEEEREAVSGRVSGLEGDALVSEMALVDHALASPNADRALRTMLKLDDLAFWDTNERLTPEIREMLVTGVADARSDSERGQEGVLGVAGAVRSAESLLAMSHENYATTSGLLARAGGEDQAGKDASAVAEQQLILKALGARKDHLRDGYWSRLVGAGEGADIAMQQVSDFADTIRGTNRDDLMRVTSPLDIHDSNDSFFNKNNLIDGADYDGTNDGLVQRYIDSCGPAVAQTVAAEADPVLALRMHQEGIQDMGTETATTMEQKVLLEGIGGGSAKSRLLEGELNSLTLTIKRMGDEGSLSPSEVPALQHYFHDDDATGMDGESVEQAIKKIRSENGDIPTDTELMRMQANEQATTAGSPINDILHAYTQPRTGQEYEGEELNKRSPDPDAITALAEDLRMGRDIPLRVAMSFGGHFITAVDVRDAHGEYSFLIADPSTGSTAWVRQNELTGGHLDTVFGWSTRGQLAAIYNRDPK